MNYGPWKNYNDPRRMAFLEIQLAQYKVRKTRGPVTQEKCKKDAQLQRKRLYGTNKSLEAFLRDQKVSVFRVCLDIGGVQLLANLLKSYLYNAFYPYEKEWYQEELDIFLETALILLSRHDAPGECIFDSILTLADCWAKDIEVYQIVYEGYTNDFIGEMDDYYNDMSDYLQDFIAVHGDAARPSDFSSRIAFALGCFLGKFYAA